MTVPVARIYRMDVSFARRVSMELQIQGAAFKRSDVLRMRGQLTRLLDSIEDSFDVVEGCQPPYPASENDHRTVSVRSAGDSRSKDSTYGK